LRFHPQASREVLLIIGASGQLGSFLAEAFAGRDILKPSHAECDVTDHAAVRAYLQNHRPQVVINCSAFHNVEQCEKNPEMAFRVNALAVDAIAEACAGIGASFATISTDYVFEGNGCRPYDEHDAPNPLSAYGASKLAGELLVRRHGTRHFIFRTSGVYAKSGMSNKGYTFIERVLQQAERGEPVRIVNNMTFSPSYAPHVARVMRDVIVGEAFGTHHVTNAGQTTWYDFARYAFERSGLEPDLAPIQYDAYGSGVKRPLFSPLVTATLPAVSIAIAPPWQAGVDAFLAERVNRRSTSV
jgi:dTDP-4-dehydrorhamnose reductase